MTQTRWRLQQLEYFEGVTESFELHQLKLNIWLQGGGRLSSDGLCYSLCMYVCEHVEHFDPDLETSTKVKPCPTQKIQSITRETALGSFSPEAENHIIVRIVCRHAEETNK